jgi:hypothetical protein
MCVHCTNEKGFIFFSMGKRRRHLFIENRAFNRTLKSRLHIHFAKLVFFNSKIENEIELNSLALFSTSMNIHFDFKAASVIKTDISFLNS